jgi:hypothetical protein
MPMYIPRGGEQTFAAPFVQTGTKLMGWLMKADLAAQQSMIDRYLNAPMNGQSGFTYRALMPSVLFAIAPIEATRSLTEPDSGYGYTPETDVAFWVLVGRGHEENGRWKLDRLLWFLPYVFVDVPMTMATGREVYGYPKEIAYLTWPSGSRDPLVMSAETLVLPVYSPDTKLVRAPILEVRKTGGKPGILERLGSAFGSLAPALAHLGLDAVEHPHTDLDVLGALEASLGKLEIPMVFLKQFRDIVEPNAACYQAIVESPARLASIPIGWPTLEDVAITVYDYASHPIATELGLGTPVDGKLTVNVPFGFEVHFDFVVELGQIVWKST